MTEPDPAKSDPLQEANDKIRGAAKWLIASSAAVGAALLAGSYDAVGGKQMSEWINYRVSGPELDALAAEI